MRYKCVYPQLGIVLLAMLPMVGCTNSTTTATSSSSTTSTAQKPIERETCFIGDSIESDSGGKNYLGSGWVYQSAVLSKQLVYMSDPSNNLGVAGANTQSIANVQVPEALAMDPQPHFCVVKGGTNDISVLPQGQTIANLSAMWAELKAGGITPIASTIPPKNGHAAEVKALNAAITSAATAAGVTLVDFYTPLVGADGNYAAGYSDDGIHPSRTGAHVMANTYIAALSSLYGTGSVYLPTGTESANYVANPLMENCTNGAPAHWLEQSYGPEAAPTVSCAEDAAITGQWLNMTFQASGNSGQVRVVGPNFVGKYTPGDRMLLVARIKITGLETSGAFLTFYGGYLTDVSYRYSSDVPDGILAVEYTAPPSGGVGPVLIFESGTSKGAVTVSLAQVGVYDLTATNAMNRYPWTTGAML